MACPPTRCFIATLLLCLMPAGAHADRVFFVGHSLVNFEMPHILNALAKAAGAEHRQQVQVTNGAPLKWNWTHSAEAQGVDGRVELAQHPYDVLVLTPASPIQTHVQWNEPWLYGGNFVGEAQKGNPRVRVFLYHTWPSLDASQWQQDSWEAELEADRAALAEVAQKMRPLLPAGQAVRVVPAADAVAALKAAIAAGEVPGLHKLEDVFADTIHLNPVGRYYIAQVFFATLYPERPEAMPRQIKNEWGGPLVGLEPATARALWTLAWRVVDEAAGER